ncbi:hypothetical protein EW146_g7083 [Bondarzewia mesenterica]|uniref:Rab proteins geranylgeranyltransferase n=1 Tax=Bondarzewia mesenterica TaxID=1095465 RepID=A0A4S4LLY6_9AGAM|nr:hypothetical protein EW146_g7083 [Bondarzewia mesenterica]
MDAEGNFDVVILGTGLVESMTAAALSKAGFKVAHLDVNPYYGGDDASLSLDELARWADQRSSSEGNSDYLSAQRAKFTLLERVGVYDREAGIKNVPGSKEDIFKSKEMSLVAKRRLMRFLMFAAGDFEGKNELEGKNEAPFVEFLRTVWSLDQQVSEAIAYALAFCVSPEDHTLPALLRMRHYLRSSGRYGSSPFLAGHYGGSGEIAQGFCRVSAVNGGVYILDRKVKSVTRSPQPQAQAQSASASDGGPESNPAQNDRYTFELDDFPEPFTADFIISSSDLLPENLINEAFPLPSEGSAQPRSIARCIAIIDSPLQFPSVSLSEPATPPDEGEPGAETDTTETPTTSPAEKPVDTSVLIFPPSSLVGGSETNAVQAFVTGEGNMSAPKGKYIVYLSLPLPEASPSTLSPESMLEPYLEAILSLTQSSPTPDVPIARKPLFTLYYIQHPSPPLRASPSAPTGAPPTVFVPPPIATGLTESADAASVAAEALFFKAIESHRARHPEAWATPQVVGGETQIGSGGDVFEEITAFWPPLADAEQDDVEGW